MGLPSHPEAEGGNRARLRSHLGRRPTPWQASGVLEAAGVWPPLGHRSIQDQRRATPTSQPEVRDCHLYQASAERKEDQKAVDAAVLAAAKKVPYMVSYLASNFSLQNGQNPATMKF